MNHKNMGDISIKGKFTQKSDATAGDIDAKGSVLIDGEVTFASTATSSIKAVKDIKINATTTAPNLNATGDVTIAANLTSSGTAGISGKNVSITGGKLTLAYTSTAGIAATSGNVSIGESVALNNSALGVVKAVGEGNISISGGGTASILSVKSAKGAIVIDSRLTDAGSAAEISTSEGGNITLNRNVSVKDIKTTGTKGDVTLNAVTTITGEITIAGKLTVNANLSAAGKTITGDTVIITNGTIAAATLDGKTGLIDIQSDATLNITAELKTAGSGNITIAGKITTLAKVTALHGNVTLNTNGEIPSIVLTGGTGNVIIPAGRSIKAVTAVTVPDTLIVYGTLESLATLTTTGYFELASGSKLLGATSITAKGVTLASVNIPEGVTAITASDDNLLITGNGLTGTATPPTTLTATLGNVIIEGSITKVGAISAPEGDILISGKIAAAGTITAAKGDIEITADVTSAGIKATIGDILISGKIKVNPTATSTDNALEATTGNVTITDYATVKPEKASGAYVKASLLTITENGTLEIPDDTEVTAFKTNVGSIEVDGTAGFRLADAPLISSVESSYLDGVITLTVVGEDLGEYLGIWINNEEQRDYGKLNARYDEETETLTFKISDDGNGKALLGLVSDVDKGVYRNWEFSYSSPGGNVSRDDAAVSQPAPSTFITSTGWSLYEDTVGIRETYIYSDDTLRITFSFAKPATRNETLLFGPDALYKEYLSASTDVLPAGASSVEVVFTFKKVTNSGLRSEIVARTKGAIRDERLYATVKDDDGTFGIAYTSVGLTPFDVLTVSPKIVAGSIGYEGSVELGLAGGSDATLIYLPWKGAKGTWVHPDYEWTSADKSSFFESGSYVLVKDPNTGPASIRVDGPNSSTGVNPSEPPVLNHAVTLLAHANLGISDGMHYSSGQSFSFDVKLPAAPENTVSLTIVGLVDGKEVISDAKWSTIKIDDSTVKVLVTNITTDIRIALGFTTGNVVLPSVSIWSSAGVITITSPVAGTAQIYSIRGGLIKSLRYEEGSTSVSLPTGIYLVRISDVTYKVVLR